MKIVYRDQNLDGKTFEEVLLKYIYITGFEKNHPTVYLDTSADQNVTIGIGFSLM